MSLQGKAALVTGGGTGVGRATALMLAERGANVAVNYSRSADEAAQTAADIQAHGVEGLAIQADVASDAAVVAMVEQAVAAFGRLDIVVNSAGTTFFVDYDDLDGMKDKYWDRILAVNLKGPFFVSRAAAPHLKAGGDGVIVSISSLSGITGTGSSIAYAASKGALNTITKSLARTLAPEIRVNSVAPGPIDTRWMIGHEDFLQRAVDRSPVNRAATPEDIAAGVLMLVENPIMTGEVLVMDSGCGL